MDPENEISLRDELQNALTDAKERQAEPEIVTDAAEGVPETSKSRDGKGRFAAKAAEEPVAEIVEAIAEEPVAPSPIAAKPPLAWSAATRTQWDKLPPEVQAEINKREADVEKGFTRMDEERVYAKQMRDVITPYLPIIHAEGGTPQRAVQSLLNQAYVMRTGSQEQKAHLIGEIARQYGVDISAIPHTQPAQVDPQLRALQDQVQQLTAAQQAALNHKQQQDQASITGQIDAFAADPKNVHFASVRDDMAALLSGGRAKDLQEAYDMAIWARPDIRSTLQATQAADVETKRVAEKTAKADAARRAAGSVTGGPGVNGTASAAPLDRSLREELRVNLRAAQGRI